MSNKEIKETLDRICAFLKKENMELSSPQSDGRINSIINETEVLEKIGREFPICITEARSWADFFIDNTPVNIKITTTQTADNASSKEGLYYSLTGKIYCGSQDWETYLRLLKDNIQATDKDYYFLIINKNNSQDIFFNSLKCITNLVSNGNNLPFQIKWIENKKLIERNFEESKKLLLSKLGKSLELRADAYISFKKYFQDFI